MSGFAFVAWVKMAAPSSQFHANTLITFGTVTYPQALVCRFYEFSANLACSHTGAGGIGRVTSTYSSASGLALADRQWHHVAVLYDGASGTGT